MHVFSPVGSRLMTTKTNLTHSNFYVEDCQNYCSAFAFFGVTTGADNCWCSNTLALNGVNVLPIGECYTSCTGNQPEECGGLEYLLVYGTPAEATSTITVSVSPTTPTHTKVMSVTAYNTVQASAIAQTVPDLIALPETTHPLSISTATRTLSIPGPTITLAPSTWLQTVLSTLTLPASLVTFKTTQIVSFTASVVSIVTQTLFITAPPITIPASTLIQTVSITAPPVTLSASTLVQTISITAPPITLPVSTLIQTISITAPPITLPRSIITSIQTT